MLALLSLRPHGQAYLITGILLAVFAILPLVIVLVYRTMARTADRLLAEF